MGRVLAGLLLIAACGAHARSLRFASPMIGGADVPEAPLRRTERPEARQPSVARTDAMPPEAPGEVAVKPIRVASAAAADAVVASSHGVVLSRLPAPHRAADAPLPAVREPADLRKLVGFRDKRDPLVTVFGWARDLGADIAATGGPALVEWAGGANRLAAPTDVANPGDLLVFDDTDSDLPADLVAIAVARDARGVTEFIYSAGGVIRRGFVDARRPALRRDREGQVVNTFMRAGKRWPPKGTHYLAGELLGHVVRAR